MLLVERRHHDIREALIAYALALGPPRKEPTMSDEYPHRYAAAYNRGRHHACPQCGHRLLVAEPFTGQQLTECSNDHCTSHHPTGPIPIPDHIRRATAHVDQIRRELGERAQRGDL